VIQTERSWRRAKRARETIILLLTGWGEGEGKKRLWWGGYEAISPLKIPGFGRKRSTEKNLQASRSCPQKRSLLKVREKGKAPASTSAEGVKPREECSGEGEETVEHGEIT